MRRSILVVMLDVMVLSVLALTAGQRSGGERNIPIPLYRWSSVVEEGLRKEQAFLSEVQRLQNQLADANELAKQALKQAESARDDAGRERVGSQEMQARLHAMELAAEKAKAIAAMAKREAELATQASVDARRRAEESELRIIAAENAAADAQLRVAQSGGQVVVAERAAAEAEQVALLARKEGEYLQSILKKAEDDRKKAQQEALEAGEQIQQLQLELTQREEKLSELEVSEAVARERAQVVEQERERLVAKGEQAVEKVVELSEQVAELEVRKEGADQTIAQFEEEKEKAEAERKKSVWVRRDESLRSIKISYAEYNASNERTYVTRRELAMPLVQVGQAVLVPADFRKLGLGRSFFSGLSDSVTQVEGTVRSVMWDSTQALPLDSIIVPGVEPQVCFIRFTGSTQGALKSISMEALKERRLKDALLFSPDDVNEHGRVEIVPVIGRNYLTVSRTSGRRPKVGDYLMSDRGEFIGLMVTTKICYVTPQVLSRVPVSVTIPVASRAQRGGYFEEFIQRLNEAREIIDDHLKSRSF